MGWEEVSVFFSLAYVPVSIHQKPFGRTQISSTPSSGKVTYPGLPACDSRSGVLSSMALTVMMASCFLAMGRTVFLSSTRPVFSLTQSRCLTCDASRMGQFLLSCEETCSLWCRLATGEPTSTKRAASAQCLSFLPDSLEVHTYLCGQRQTTEVCRREQNPIGIEPPPCSACSACIFLVTPATTGHISPTASNFTDPLGPARLDTISRCRKQRRWRLR